MNWKIIDDSDFKKVLWLTLSAILVIVLVFAIRIVGGILLNNIFG